MSLRNYNLRRLWLVVRFMLTTFLIIKRKDSLLGLIKPLSPTELKQCILDLGASYIKLAQVLATRADYFPSAYLQELRELHDDIPAMNPEECEQIFKKAFPKDPFARFEKVPIASATIGQVHEAWLKDGTKVAVKLRRMGIEKRVRADIKILRFINSLFKPLFSPYTKHSVEAVIEEFSKMLLQEVSFRHELKNIQEFRSAYKNIPILIPMPYPEYCSDESVVMEFMEGVRFDEREKLAQLQISFPQLMDKLVSSYIEQMLIEGLFHADPHPGNLLVTPRGELVFLDFGMIKRISTATRKSIIKIVKYSNERDFAGYVRSCKELGVIAEDAPDDAMWRFAERMFSIFDDDSLSSASMQDLAFEVLASTRDLPFKFPQEAVYILRVTAIVEGLGTIYIENFNGIKDILPLMIKNMPRALGSSGKSPVETLFTEVRNFPDNLYKIRSLINDAESGRLKFGLSTGFLDKYTERARDYFKAVFLLTVIMFFGFGLLVATDLVRFGAALLLFGSVGLMLKL